jgi:Carboxypeptidase regulatory-like domain
MTAKGETMRRLSSSLSTLLIAVSGLVCTGLQAQDSRAQVQGLVTDSSKGVVVGATVSLLNINTNVRTTKVTNETGFYRFDFVEPGSYTLAVESPGFSRFTQENFPIQARGDVTVDAVLTAGSVQETVTVEGNPLEVVFNSSNVTLTIDTKLANELPRFDRNPFKLTLLLPSAVETRRSEMAPYNSYSANSVELGGGTNLKNNLIVDGSPIGIGYKVAWVPNSDAVQEANVDKNSVDASSGYSAGGAISMATKAGTNNYHGSLFWLGRNPALNAVSDRTTGTKSAARNNIYGIAAGTPIIKNKLFNFVSWEAQRTRTPATNLKSVPTALEKAGDFSQSLNNNGGLLTIYDPYTTVFNSAAGTATRQAFAGNKIPVQRFDTLGARWMNEMLSPNRTPDNPTGLNNFSATVTTITDYWDLSDRVDWYVNSKLRVFARPSVYKTNIVSPSPLQEVSPLYVQSAAPTASGPSPYRRRSPDFITTPSSSTAR